MGITNPTMEKPLSSQATNWREGRRLRALELKERGWKQSEIAEALGVTEGAVSQWMKRAKEEGAEGLKHKPPPGAPSRLSENERAKLPELLAQGAEAHGFRGEVWTCGRVAIVIRKEFGVSYHPAHVSRVVRALGLSLQKPQRRAEQRDEEAIEHWKEKKWPSLKRGAQGRQNHSLLRSVGLLPASCGGWHLRSGGTDAHPQGTSQPRSPLSNERHHPRRQALHDRAGALLQGRGCVVRFLNHLMRHIEGKLLVIWDGSPIHRGRAVKDFLSSGAARRVQLEQLPGYAPDLNPDEGIWKHLKCVELKNLCCQSLAELKVELRKAKERLRHKRDVILGCLRQPGFEV
jgi:transposase